MACKDCNNPNDIPFVALPGCAQSFIGCDNNCTSGIIDTACVIYTGPNLVCIDSVTNSCLESILTKIDAKVCTAQGDYTGYDLGCLRDGYTIDTTQQFAEAVANFVCTLRTDFDQLADTDLPADIQELQDQIDNLNNPGTTGCDLFPVTEDSTISDVLQLLSNGLCNIYSTIDPSTANWSQCFSVPDPPTDILSAFNVVIDQICQVAASTGAALPTFNNVGTCLPSPGATDSLNNTIIKIRTRLCQSPTFLASNLDDSTCVNFDNTSTLEEVIDAQNQQITAISENAVMDISSDFVLDYIDPLNHCLGKIISLNNTVVDRKVAINNADGSPGTLLDKLVSGTNVSLDFGIINAGKVTISATGGTSTDEKVKISNTDPTAGYLEDKIIDGSTNYIDTSITPISSTQLQVFATLNLAALIPDLLTAISASPDLSAQFCALVAACPSPCQPPTNVQAIQV